MTARRLILTALAVVAAFGVGLGVGQLGNDDEVPSQVTSDAKESAERSIDQIKDFVRRPDKLDARLQELLGDDFSQVVKVNCEDFSLDQPVGEEEVSRACVVHLEGEGRKIIFHVKGRGWSVSRGNLLFLGESFSDATAS